MDSFFVHRYGNQLVRTCTQHTHAHRAYIFHILFIYYRFFRFVVVDYNIAHRTLYSLVHFVALLLSLLPTVMDCFVEVERELNWTHSVGINTQYAFFSILVLCQLL